MAKKTTPLIPADLSSELFELRNSVGLCSFATEARRVLEEIDQVAKMRPDVGEVLNQQIYARRNWRELGDYESGALNDVRQRLDTLLGEEH